MSKEYSISLQKLFLEMMLAHAQSYVRVQNIYNPENFDRSLRGAAKFMKEHSEQYKILPTVDQVQAISGTALTVPVGLTEDHYDWFLTEFEGFSRRNELERAILQAAELLEKGDYDPVEKLIKDAVQIGLTRDMGTDYFLDPIARLRKIKDNNGQVSTGWVNLDKLLYGGFNRGELNIFAGGSGSGKSLFMQNISVNWVTMGLNGVYITLELSEELCAMRIDSMMTNCSTKDVFRDMETVEMKVKMAAKKSGHFRIKYMPAQSTVNDIRAYLKELQIQLGFKLDFVMVDYLDLLMPVSAKIGPSDLFVKDKYVSEELRNLAKEFHILFVTASQLNRAAVEEVEFDHSHISGGISKINTADNVFGIFTSRAMRERGKYNLQCMKTRSSSGVGQKVDLDFDVDSLRITASLDEDGGGFGKGGPNSANVMMNRIKRGAGQGGTGEDIDPETGEIVKTIKANVNSSKLKDMLNSLKTSN